MERKLRKIKRERDNERNDSVKNNLEELFQKLKASKKQEKTSPKKEDVGIENILDEIARHVFKTVDSALKEKKESGEEEKKIIAINGVDTGVRLSKKMVVNVFSDKIEFDEEYSSVDSDIIRNLISDDNYASTLINIHEDLGDYSLNTYTLKNSPEKSRLVLVEIHIGKQYPLKHDMDFLVLEGTKDTDKVVVPKWLNPENSSLKKIVSDKSDRTLIKKTFKTIIRPLKLFVGSNKAFAIVNNNPYFIVPVK